jgi:hypothetical protein
VSARRKSVSIARHAADRRTGSARPTAAESREKGETRSS